MEEIFISPRNNVGELKVPQTDNHLYNPITNISDSKFKEITDLIFSENKKYSNIETPIESK